MKFTKRILAGLLCISRQEIDELDLPEGSIEISEAIEALIAYRIEARSNGALRKKLNKTRTDLYQNQSRRRELGNALLRGRFVLGNDYRPILESRVVEARTGLLNISERLAFMDQPGMEEYAVRLRKELSDVQSALPEFNPGDFDLKNDLRSLLSQQDSPECDND